MSILDEIVAHKRGEVMELKQARRRGESMKPPADIGRVRTRDFKAALVSRPEGTVSLIAEIKKASPSAGVICEDFDPADIAAIYEAGGASCISVLTDEAYFKGALRYMAEARKAVGIPVLRKDFIIDEIQIEQAYEWGADAILLIAAILDDDELVRFRNLAGDFGLCALCEVHDESELKRVFDSGADLIGINNRDLKTFSVDLAVTERLTAMLRGFSGGKDKVVVSESGIFSGSDIARLVRCGVDAVLAGEALMREADMKMKVAELSGHAKLHI